MMDLPPKQNKYVQSRCLKVNCMGYFTNRILEAVLFFLVQIIKSFLTPEVLGTMQKVSCRLCVFIKTPFIAGNRKTIKTSLNRKAICWLTYLGILGYFTGLKRNLQEHIFSTMGLDLCLCTFHFCMLSFCR